MRSAGETQVGRRVVGDYLVDVIEGGFAAWDGFAAELADPTVSLVDVIEERAGWFQLRRCAWP